MARYDLEKLVVKVPFIIPKITGDPMYYRHGVTEEEITVSVVPTFKLYEILEVRERYKNWVKRYSEYSDTRLGETVNGKYGLLSLKGRMPVNQYYYDLDNIRRNFTVCKSEYYGELIDCDYELDNSFVTIIDAITIVGKRTRFDKETKVEIIKYLTQFLK